MGGGGMSGFMTGRSTSNLLTRATAILAAAFMTTSILLVVMHNRERAPRSIIDQGAPAAAARCSGSATAAARAGGARSAERTARALNASFPAPLFTM